MKVLVKILVDSNNLVKVYSVNVLVDKESIKLREDALKKSSLLSFVVISSIVNIVLKLSKIDRELTISLVEVLDDLLRSSLRVEVTKGTLESVLELLGIIKVNYTIKFNLKDNLLLGITLKSTKDILKLVLLS